MTVKERVTQELLELTARIQILAAFISGDVFDTLSGEHRALLHIQLATMQALHEVLAQRLLIL